jgi:hypothetical protein
MAIDTLRDIFIDESSQNDHAYFVMGGISVCTSDVAKLTERLLTARNPELPKGEMKWTKVSRGKLVAYRRVIDAFFDNDADFHSLVVETRRQDHAAFNQGSHEVGFNKEVFQLAMKFSRLYHGRFHIYPDQRTTTQKLEDLRFMLNRKIMQREPKRDWPFRRVQFRDSAATPVLQVTDILSGAIAYKLNLNDKAKDASPAKIDLSDYICTRARVANVFRDTAVRGKFTIWHRRLRGVP